MCVCVRVVKMSSELLLWAFCGPSLSNISLVREIPHVMKFTNVKLILQFSFEHEKHWKSSSAKPADFAVLEMNHQLPICQLDVQVFTIDLSFSECLNICNTSLKHPLLKWYKGVVHCFLMLRFFFFKKRCIFHAFYLYSTLLFPFS